MSDKMECPGCGTCSSSVLARVSDDLPCPFCGLSAAAIIEIRGVRRTNADADLKQRLEDALKRADRAETAAASAYTLADELREALRIFTISTGGSSE